MTGAARLGTTLLSAIVLVVVNAIPLVGIAFWGWSLMMVLVLLIGLLTVFDLGLHLREHRAAASPMPSRI